MDALEERQVRHCAHDGWQKPRGWQWCLSGRRKLEVGLDCKGLLVLEGQFLSAWEQTSKVFNGQWAKLCFFGVLELLQVLLTGGVVERIELLSRDLIVMTGWQVDDEFVMGKDTVADPDFEFTFVAWSAIAQVDKFYAREAIIGRWCWCLQTEYHDEGMRVVSLHRVSLMGWMIHTRDDSHGVGASVVGEFVVPSLEEVVMDTFTVELERVVQVLEVGPVVRLLWLDGLLDKDSCHQYKECCQNTA